jgi:hypothetical protein
MDLSIEKELERLDPEDPAYWEKRSNLLEAQLDRLEHTLSDCEKVRPPKKYKPAVPVTAGSFRGRSRRKNRDTTVRMHKP